MDDTSLLIGPYERNRVVQGDSFDLVPGLPDESIDILVTSPPYWGQRLSKGVGVEEDPREFVTALCDLFSLVLPKMKPEGIVWINIGDSYNTPVNWSLDDRKFSTLGADKQGLNPENTAYTKPRAKREAFIDKSVPWLTYGNLLGLTYRMVVGMCDRGFLYRGEVIWRKKNAMPEGKCRRPHRQHEPIYLFARNERHQFRVSPPVPSVWEIANDKIDGPRHFSRFPLDLPRRCIDAYGKTGEDIVVLDPFSGAGTTGIAAIQAGCTYIGFEIDPEQANASNGRLEAAELARKDDQAA